MTEKQVSLSGVVIRRSDRELAIEGRLRIGPAAILSGALLTIALAVPTGPYFRILLSVGTAVAAFQAIVQSRTRLVLQPSGFSLVGYEWLRRYRLTGQVPDLDIVGVIAMRSDFENMPGKDPDKDPDYFLQLVVAGKTIRVFRGLARRDLDEVMAQIHAWKASCAP